MRVRIVISAFTLAIIIAVFCSSFKTTAWSNGGYSADPSNPDYGTHDWIADMALSIQTKDVTFLTTTYHTEFLLGTEAPDNPDYIGDSWNHHVYYYSNGTLQDDIGASRANDMYVLAWTYLINGSFENAAFYLGAMTHYIADVGVFGHTMGSGTDWGSETHHSDYENEIESRLGSISPPPIALANTTPYFATTHYLAGLITFGFGKIQSNVWMDTNYDWSNSTFEASAMESLFVTIGAVAAVINYFLINNEALIPEFGNGFIVVVIGTALIAIFVSRYRK